MEFAIGAIVLAVLFCGTSNCTKSPAPPPKLEERYETRKNFADEFQISEAQKQKIYSIAENEYADMRPLALNLYTKEDRMHELLSKKCILSVKCKKERREKINNLQADIDETRRQINVKKTYYTILYKNVLNREQGMLLNELLYEHFKKTSNY